MVRVLVLYPGNVRFRQAQVATHKPLLDALGIELVLCDDYVDPTDREVFADVIELPPPTRVGDGLRRIEAALSRREAHAVVAQSESAACLGSLVARRIGAPALTPEAALATTSKLRTRRALLAAGVPQPRFALVSTAAEVRAFARDVGYPVVLKGVASALGRLVTMVRDEREVDDAVARVRVGLPESVDVERLRDFAREARLDLECDPREQFLVESFARGAPVETDGVVSGPVPGRIPHANVGNYGVTEQALSRPPLFFMEGYLLPADRPAHELAEIERVSDAALRATGVGNSGFSVELRLDEGRASIIEVNGRLGWDEGFGDLFALVTGSQPAFHTLQVALGQPIAFERDPNVHAALAYACCYDDRIVARVPTQREIEAVSASHHVSMGLAVFEGDRVYAPPHPDATPHLAYALATDARSSAAAYARARAAVDELVFELRPVAP